MVDYQAMNVEAAEAILAIQDKYTGLPLEWALLVLAGLFDGSRWSVE